MKELASEAHPDVAGKYVAPTNRVIELALLDSTDPAYGPTHLPSVLALTPTFARSRSPTRRHGRCRVGSRYDRREGSSS